MLPNRQANQRTSRSLQSMIYELGEWLQLSNEVVLGYGLTFEITGFDDINGKYSHADATRDSIKCFIDLAKAHNDANMIFESDTANSSRCLRLKSESDLARGFYNHELVSPPLSDRIETYRRQRGFLQTSASVVRLVSKLVHPSHNPSKVSQPGDGNQHASKIDNAIARFRSSTNGKQLLEEFLAAIYPDHLDRVLERAIARITLFSHPNTVAELRDTSKRVSPMFAIIRSPSAKRKGEIVSISNDHSVMLDDNERPVDNFCLCNNLKRSRAGLDCQFNHIWGKPIASGKNTPRWTLQQEFQLYTNLANLCLTPAFLAKLTDTDPRIKELLKYRAQELYGDFGQPDPQLPKPSDMTNCHGQRLCPIIQV